MEFFKRNLSIVLILLPLLSLIGSIYMSTYNNIVSLFVILMIVLLSLYTSFQEELPSKYYVMLLYSISISLLLQSSWISNHLVGSDMNTEYLVYQYTQKRSYWGEIGYAFQNILNYNSMLSITIFPTVIKNVTAINDILIFKIIYPMIFSFTVINIYLFNKQIQNSNKNGFISSLLFISPFSYSSIEMISLGRQMIAMTFLSLMMFFVLKRKIKSRESFVVLILLYAGIIFSHYSTFYISIFILIITYLFSKNIKKNINLYYIMLILIIALVWYLDISYQASPIYSASKAILGIINAQTHEAFASNLNEVMLGSVLRTIGALIFYLVQGIIFLGFIYVMKNRKRYPDYYPISLASMIIIISAVIIPGLGYSLMITRFYQISLMFLSPLLILGISWSIKSSLKLNNYQIQVISSLIIIIFFVFQIGLIYEIAGDTKGLTRKSLSMKRIDENVLYPRVTNDWDVDGAIWLSKNIREEMKTYVFSDAVALWHVLPSYGLIPSNIKNIFQNSTKIIYGYIFLTRYNTEFNNIIVTKRGTVKSSEFLNEEVLNDNSLIFSNGGSKIFFVSGVRE